MRSLVPGPPRGRRRRLADASAELAERIAAARSAEELSHDLGQRLRGLAQLGRDTAALLRDLAADERVPFRVPATSAVLSLVYVLSPIGILPGRLRALGRLDDLIVIWWAWRRVLRASGYDVIYEHWRGTDEGLATVLAVSGVAR